MAEKKEGNAVNNMLVGLITAVLGATRDLIYDMVIFPIATITYRAIYHLPGIGEFLTDQVIDPWLARLSDDWPDKLKP